MPPLLHDQRKPDFPLLRVCPGPILRCDRVQREVKLHYEVVERFEMEKYDGMTMLREATGRLGIHLSVLVAETSLWANPEVHRRLIAENGTGAYFPNTRRYRVRAGEQRRQVCGTDLLDDNTYANIAIKRAVGISRLNVVGFETCHIWPQSCYDTRCHTVIANLVLIPRPLAGLSDHDPEIEAALQFRAYELYRWHPAEHSQPKKPKFYPTTWREPMPFTPKVAKALTSRRLR